MNNNKVKNEKLIIENKNVKQETNNCKLTIGHLYPEEMNIYGDFGNIITLKQRCIWRGIDVEVINIGKGQLATDNSKLGTGDCKIDADLYFMGGGQDNDMYKVFEDLIKFKKEFIIKEMNDNKVFFLICGGFELFGKYFLDTMNREIKGLNLIPIVTKAPGNTLEERCLGNLVYRLTDKIKNEIRTSYSGECEDTVVGFENHAGQVFFTDDSIVPIGNVLYGKGNNAKEKIEGARYKNVFGSFTHGSVLPKNPHLADLLITLALKNKYKRDIKLTPLDDEIEWMTHKSILKKLINA